MRKSQNSAQIIPAAIFFAAGVFLPLYEVKPNRVSSGLEVGFFDLSPWIPGLLLVFFLLVFFTSIFKHSWHNILPYVLSIGVLNWLAFVLAPGSAFEVQGIRLARISPGLGSLFFLLGALVPYLDSKGENSGKDLNRIKISLLFIPFVLVVFFVATGMASHLGFIKEWAIKPDLFWGKVGGHLRISIFALGLAVFLGIPLAHYAFQSRAFESLINPALNITQTIPSLVFFGFFMTMIFGALTVFPWLSNLGIASTGDTPVILALGVYALFPITKNTLVAFRSVNPEVVEAARGMGYTSSQIWKNIRLPLSLPILLGGVRIALVQTLGGAVLAKLINGDGLGYYVIEGLYTRVNDMAILGVISLIGLTLVVELCFAYIQRSFDPLNRPDNSFVNGPRDTEGGKT